MFKIIEKGAMPDGVQIQLEDWGHHLTIAAYPTAARESRVFTCMDEIGRAHV